ncbi:hypothetical protein [Gracilimonas sp.]|uniref:hypothetical protein n=1 Tax=Gracilimonas TaxID=649462 RepID=UPI0025C3073E|nr:hypothetical protein [Gracilimonas sp.]
MPVFTSLRRTTFATQLEKLGLPDTVKSQSTRKPQYWKLELPGRSVAAGKPIIE